MDCRKLNEVFNIEGPNFIEEDESCYIPFQEDSTWNDWVLFQKGHTTNKGRPTSALQKEKARENALKRNANQKGANNRNSKTWQIEYIDGRIEIVKSIHSWIVGKNYSKAGIYKMRVGKFKKYKDIKSISIIVSNPETVV